MNVSDETLASAAASGDAVAFAALLERRYDGLFRLCFRLTGTRTEAEDLTQDICASLPGKLASFRADARVSTWLYRVAVNAAHDRRRRAATHARMAKGWGNWEIGRRADMDDAADQANWLEAAMQALTADLRDTLALLLGDELTHAEAAAVLGVSEGTISWRVSEAKKRLRAIAQEDAAR